MAVVLAAGSGLPAQSATPTPAQIAQPSAIAGSPASPPALPPASPPASALPSASAILVGPSASPFPPLAAGVVPILYLHRVVAPPAAWTTWTAARRKAFLAYNVIPAAFAADLDWLQANGYTTILPRDLAAHWDRGAPLPRRPVIITLDDGHPSWVTTVLPMLQARHMVAEFYLTLDAIDRGSISWRQVEALAKAGMGIGAHDVDHIQLAGLGPSASPVSPEEMWFQVNEARLIIGQHIGSPPDSMAYVGGGFDATLVGLVRKAGYTTARSIIRGIRQPERDRYALRVVALAPMDDVIDPVLGTIAPGVPTFAAKVTGAAT
ncbi:MAG TPA: polysaccharide deacetylase family protein [Candidatus Limnocylindrales bacterium]